MQEKVKRMREGDRLLLDGDVVIVAALVFVIVDLLTCVVLDREKDQHRFYYTGSEIAKRVKNGSLRRIH